MSQLTVIADIRANADKIDLVRRELQKLIPDTRAEPGCLQYDLHRVNGNPMHFFFYETWESREHWQQHMHSPHVQAYMTATRGAIAEFTVHEMTKVK